MVIIYVNEAKPSTQIVKFMVFGSNSWVQAKGQGHYGHIVKIYKILENGLLYSHVNLRKTKIIDVMSMKPSSKIMKLIAPRSGVQTLGQGLYDHIVKCIKSSPFSYTLE